ncbi:uncharacterized protein LOC123879952 [Maniola jurtina]|uniref:uncharacterized protein LOC123879952 n=1 Tax=Maniola jurtina TaxID=191418 RepID=UPI001E68D40E|nr:uncharacterized protein LOC123879952 [Maniola jurtina]
MSLKELIIKRSSVKGRVTKFKNYIPKFNKLSVLNSLELGELKLKLGKIECLASEFSDVQGQIESLSGDTLNAELDIREEIENELDSVTALAQDILSRNSRVPCFEDAHSSNSLGPGQGVSQGHFLIGRPPTTLPSPNIEDFSSSSLDRYSKLELVLLQEDNVAPLNWRLDWVTALYPELMEFPVSPIS